MVISDPVEDILNKLRSATDANSDEIELPDSKIKREICRILLAEGFIKSFEVIPDAPQNRIKVTLGYDQLSNGQRTPTIRGIKRVSKPGLRVYVNPADIPSIQRGMGVAIVTTSRGVMTGKQARRLGIGGEVLAYVY